MNKVFISALALAMSVMAMATETAYVECRLTGESGLYDEITLTEDNSYTNEYEGGSDTEKMMYQANTRSVLIYGLVGTTLTPCGDVAALNLDGLFVGITTNQVDQNYTLTFSNFSGRELTLLDKVTNEVITINATTPAYNFSVTPAQVGRVAINDRFVIGGTPEIITTEFCFNYNILTVNGHGGESLVVKQGTKEIVNIPSLGKTYQLDLSKEKGRFVVTLDKKDYQIDVNPDVTPYTPAP